MSDSLDELASKSSLIRFSILFFCIVYLHLHSFNCSTFFVSLFSNHYMAFSGLHKGNLFRFQFHNHHHCSHFFQWLQVLKYVVTHDLPLLLWHNCLVTMTIFLSNPLLGSFLHTNIQQSFPSWKRNFHS